jgi:hypothetical protein
MIQKQLAVQKQRAIYGNTIAKGSSSMNAAQQIPSSQNNLHTLLGINSTTSFDDLYLKQSNTEYVKKYEVFETTEDILALSVTWHRMRSSLSHKINMIAPDNRPTKLTDSVLFREMIQEDKDRADIIRDYYSKKLMVITLREQRISKFRKDLSTFVHGDNKVVKEEMMPLIYRLPEFYEYDMGFDEMFRDLNKQFEHQPKLTIGGDSITLTPLRKFIVKLRTSKFTEYWLKDVENKAYKIEIPIENKLNHLWEHFFEQDSIPLTGYLKHMERDGINYFHLKNWEIDFTKT